MSLISNLKAVYRNGQVFLTWDEADSPPGMTFSVYLHTKPIDGANISAAARIAHHIQPHSARDWWQDPASFIPTAPTAPKGFVIEDNGEPLDPAGGLFVHTVTEKDEGARHYAVVPSDREGEVGVGVNSLAKPVRQKVALARAIWLRTDAVPCKGSGKGKALMLTLHGRGSHLGPVTEDKVEFDVNYLVFGDAKQGWREGLPFKFRVEFKDEFIRIVPTDYSWVNRPVLESWDKRDHVPAVNSFWYGYNSNIYDQRLMQDGIVHNYVEEYLLWLARWGQEFLGADADRTYIRGGSMGGSGSISMALHHPHVFAATVAQVPIVSYTQPGQGSAKRLETVCGPLDEAVMTNEGIPVLERMNGEILAQNPARDLPFMFLTHGRKDGSIPWENNPPFYRALEKGRHAFAAYWDDGEHSTMGKDAPADVKGWDDPATLLAFRRDKSFPAFSNCSADKNPGDGDPSQGDIIGWINRGLGWRDIEDQADCYAITITAAHAGIRYPLTVDMTIRRPQRFKAKAGEKLIAKIGAAEPQEVAMDKYGLVTVKSVRIESDEGVRVEIARLKGEIP